MRKDELLALCRQQERLLDDARRLLDERQNALERLLPVLDQREAMLREQTGRLNDLARDNERLKLRCAELRDLLNAQERRFVTTIERLNAAWRTSCATWAAEWNEKWSGLSGRLQALTGPGSSSLPGSSDNWIVSNDTGDPTAGGMNPDPESCERIVHDFVTGLVSDLERTLPG